MHYVRLILEYGPIIHCSTLRFESKHTYFKRVIRAKKCFINVCSSLAFSHQYLQACLLQKGLFAPDLEFTQVFGCSGKITELLEKNGLPINLCSFAQAIKFRGVYYVTGSYVVLDKILNDLVLGKVIALFVTSHNRYLVIKKVFVKYFHYYGMHALEKNVTNDVTCIEVNPLKDYFTHSILTIWDVLMELF